MTNPPRILVLSHSPYWLTSFSHQCVLLARYLQTRGFDVHYVGSGYHGEPVMFETFPLYPFVGAGSGDIKDSLVYLIQRLRPQVMISELVGGDELILDLCRVREQFSETFWVHLTLQARTPFEQKEIDLMQSIDSIHVESQAIYDVHQPKFSNLVCNPQGPLATLFQPLTAAKRQKVRQCLQINHNTFVVGSVFRNWNVKGIMELLETFSRFAFRKSDVLLYLHTNPNYQQGLDGFDLETIINTHSQRRKIRFTGLHKVGFQEVLHRYVYNVMDVHLLTTYGESWGFPTVEAGLCGVPSLVTDALSTGELLGSDRGWRIPVRHKLSYGYTEFFQADTSAAASMLEEAYCDAEQRIERGRRMNDHARVLFTFEAFCSRLLPDLEKGVEHGRYSPQINIGDASIPLTTKRRYRVEFILADPASSHQYGECVKSIEQSDQVDATILHHAPGEYEAFYGFVNHRMSCTEANFLVILTAPFSFATDLIVRCLRGLEQKDTYQIIGPAIIETDSKDPTERMDETLMNYLASRSGSSRSAAQVLPVKGGLTTTGFEAFAFPVDYIDYRFMIVKLRLGKTPVRLPFDSQASESDQAAFEYSRLLSTLGFQTLYAPHQHAIPMTAKSIEQTTTIRQDPAFKKHVRRLNKDTGYQQLLDQVGTTTQTWNELYSGSIDLRVLQTLYSTDNTISNDLNVAFDKAQGDFEIIERKLLEYD